MTKGWHTFLASAGFSKQRPKNVPWHPYSTVKLKCVKSLRCGIKLEFGAYLKPGSQEKSLSWISSVMQWEENICFKWKFKGYGINELCFSVAGFGCTGIILTGLTAFQADIYNLCILSSKCQHIHHANIKVRAKWKRSDFCCMSYCYAVSCTAHFL